MARVRFKAQLALDPQTGLPSPDVLGAEAFIVAEGTNTNLTLYDGPGVSALVIPQPVSVTALGFVPQFWVEDPGVDVELVSGALRTPLESAAGLKEAAVAAVGEAEDAAAAADASAADAEASRIAAEAAGARELPQDGTTGQVLAKASGAAGDVEWVTPSGGGGGGGGVSVHGQLSGLDADDHGQYHTDSRGDARYYRKSEVDTAVAAAATAASAADRNRANHSGEQPVSSITGLEPRLTALEAGGGGGGGPITTDAITDMTATGKLLAKASSAANARGHIGAGTSNVAIGTVAGTAADAVAVATALSGKAASTHSHTAAQITDLSSALGPIVEPLVEPIVEGMAAELGDAAVARTVYGSHEGEILPPWNTSPAFGAELWKASNFHGSGQNALAPTLTANGSAQELITYVMMGALNNGGLDPYRLEFDVEAPASGWASIYLAVQQSNQTNLPGTADQYVITHESPSRTAHVVVDFQVPDFNGAFSYLKVRMKMENNVTAGQVLRMTNVSLRRIPKLTPPMLVAYGFAPGAPTVWMRHASPRGTRKTTKTLINDGGIASTLAYNTWNPWRWSLPDPAFVDATGTFDGKHGLDETKVGIVSDDLNVGNNDQILSVQLPGGTFELRGNVHGGEAPQTGSPVAYKIDEGKGAGLVPWLPGASPSFLKPCRRYQVQWDTQLTRTGDSSPFALVDHLTTVFDDGMIRTDRSTTFPASVVIGDNFEWMSSHKISPLWQGRIGKGQTVIADVDTRGLVAPLTTAPTTSTATTGGTLPAGTHRYYVTLLTDYGETTPGPEAARTTTGSTSTVTVTYGPGYSGITGVRAWRLYRTSTAGGTPLLVATLPATTSGYTDTGAVVPSTPVPKVNTGYTTTPTRREAGATDATWAVWYDPDVDLCYANIFDRDAVLSRAGVQVATTRLQMVPGSITKQYINAVWTGEAGTIAVGPSTPAWEATHWSYIYTPADPERFHREVADKAANLGALRTMYPTT